MRSESLLRLYLKVKEIKQIFIPHNTPNLRHLFSRLYIWIQSLFKC